ncbi:MAG: hypothetical protein KME26_15715 [Oscillatoria princeps RMCB-10]|nr:hypothetical protein [Oscillatoria princeps RMCB-10]
MAPGGNCLAVRKGQEEKCWPVGEPTGDRVCWAHRLPPFWAKVRRVGIAQHCVPVALMQL